MKQQQRTKNSLGGQTADKCPPELRDRDRIKSLDKRENNIREKKNTHTFIKPTVEEVRAYCSERGNGIDAQRFVDYYTANGWKVGKNPMKDWKAAVRTWERGNGNTAKTYTSAELNAMTDNLTYDDL